MTAGAAVKQHALHHLHHSQALNQVPCSRGKERSHTSTSARLRGGSHPAALHFRETSGVRAKIFTFLSMHCAIEASRRKLTIHTNFRPHSGCFGRVLRRQKPQPFGGKEHFFLVENLITANGNDHNVAEFMPPTWEDMPFMCSLATLQVSRQIFCTCCSSALPFLSPPAT